MVGRSLFECHGSGSEEKIKAIVEKLKNHSQEMFLKVSVRNERVYVVPVRDEKGELIGYYERFEMNVQM